MRLQPGWTQQLGRLPQGRRQEVISPMPRISVVQINVHDIDRAIDFYQLLGFSVASRDHYPQIVKLADDDIERFPLLLYRVDQPAKIDYPHDSQVLFNVETDNLESALARLREQGVEVIHDTPEPCPVGIYAGVRDPSGNVLESLVPRIRCS